MAVQTPSPSLLTEPLKPGPLTQKSRERWQTRDEAVLVQLWADNIDCLESKDSRKAWDEIVRALNDKQGITKTVDQCQPQVGITTLEPALDAKQTPEGHSTPSPATSSSSAQTTRCKERKNWRRRTRAAESDSEEEGFRDVMKKL